LIAGAVVLAALTLMGGDLRMFADSHAAIVIFGGSFAATLIRLPLSSIFHGLPLGARYAFSMRRITQRELVDEIAELAELSKHIMIEETKQGLNIEIVDQNGRSMFPLGSKEPYERTRRPIQRLAAPLKATAFRISVTGHTSATRLPTLAGYGPWELSADRANAIRKQLEADGVPSGNFFMVAGKADTQPLFPDDPYIAANRRVTITLMREEPPMPAGARPWSSPVLSRTRVSKQGRVSHHRWALSRPVEPGPLKPCCIGVMGDIRGDG